VAGGGTEEDIIEKIDIGGISLIRGAAKNFNDVLIVASRRQYGELLELLQAKNGSTDLTDRRKFAGKAFDVTSHYDTAIFNYFNSDLNISSFKKVSRVEEYFATEKTSSKGHVLRRPGRTVRTAEW
jgi:phosphoribosylaminoimidazolecarboxamide formyltransferase/IMP cyclohydrolase